MPSVFALSIILCSCTPDDQEDVLQPNAVNLSQNTFFINNSNIPVWEGMLNIDDFEKYSSLLSEAFPANSVQPSSDEIRQWESQIGFKSMYVAYLDAEHMYDVSEVEDLASSLVEIENVVGVFEDGLKAVIQDPAVRLLVNDSGLIRIEDYVYKYSEHSIAIATVDQYLNRQETFFEDASNLVYTYQNWQHSISIGSESIQKSDARGCSTGEVNDHRVRGDWGVNSSVRPNRGAGGFGGIVSFTINTSYFANAKVEDRGWFNRWTRDNTRLSFVCGVKAVGFPGSGQGWTSSSDIHEINVSWPAAPTRTLPNTGQNSPGPRLEYVTGGTDDENISGLFCFGCFPWDCSDLNESNIP